MEWHGKTGGKRQTHTALCQEWPLTVYSIAVDNEMLTIVTQEKNLLH